MSVGRKLGRGPGRTEIRAGDPTLTPYAGLAIVGELVRRLRLCERIDEQLAGVRRAKPVKRRRRGLTAGALLLSLAEAQLVGGDFFADLEELRADGAGAPLRAVEATPAAATALQPAKRFRRSHLQALERALAKAGEALDRSLGRDPGEPVTIDLDATEVEVYGRRKQGARRSHSGCLACAPYVAGWAERGRALAFELEPGNRAKLPARESARLARRALALLPEGHGEVSFRLDSAFYAVELPDELRRLGARFSCSLPRTKATWEALAAIPAEAWREAAEMPGAEVGETSYRPAGWEGEPLRLIVRRVLHTASELCRDPRARRLRTIHPDQLALALGGELDSVLRLLVHPQRPAGDGRGGRALPPPPGPDRGALQGGQARPGAPPPPLREPRREPGLACGLAARPQPRQHVLRPLPRGRRLGPGRGGRAAAPGGEDAAPPLPARAGQDRALRPPDQPAPPAGFRHLELFRATYDAVRALAPP